MTAARLLAQPGDDHPVSARVLDEAIAWQLRLGSGEAGHADHHAFQHWVGQRTEHARAWRQLGAIDADFAPARPGPVRAVLVRSSTHRLRQVGTVLVVALAATMGLAMFDRSQPLGGLLADLGTATGERRSVVLPDQSVLHLNTRSAVDVAFDARQRLLLLREGEIHVETVRGQPTDPRPFIVSTPQGSLRALGTRFLVRRTEEGTALTVTEAAVAARPASCAPEPEARCAAERIVRAGESLVLRDEGLSPIRPAAPEADAWKDGMLVVENRTLAEVAAEIARHRSGTVRVDPQVADLRVTGTVPLNDTDAALSALTSALPVQVVYRTGWWVTVAPR